MARTGTLQRAFHRAAARAPWSAWAWRNTAFVTAGVALGLAGVALGFELLALIATATSNKHQVSVLLLAFFVVIAVMTLPVVIRLLTALQRSRFWSLLGLDVPRMPRKIGWHTMRGTLEDLGSKATWRQLAYHTLVAPLVSTGAVLVVCAWTAGLVCTLTFTWVWALPLSSRPPGGTERYWLLTALGMLLLLGTPWLAAIVVRLDIGAAAALLGLPSRAKELERRVGDLAESRAEVLDAADMERRRIERDLHDGAQQRLVSLAMNLGLARATLNDLSPAARQVIDEAHSEAKEAIEELNNLIRGLHPAVLDARGLDAALSGVAARAPLPVHLNVDMAEPASPTVEAVAYYVVSEALANVTKHARASGVDVQVRRTEDVLSVTITDDGVGGADASHGTGLAGLAKRVSSVDGTLRIISPRGGPTIIAAELPCEL